MRQVTLLVGLLVSVALVGCSSQPGAPASGSARRLLAGQPMTPCLVQGEIPVKAEVAGLCGILQVPEDRSDAAGRQIGLRVAIVPALAAVPEPDPLFAIAGGPGDASTQFFAWLPGHYKEIHATRDIVLVDQRGTGGSNPLTLGEPPDTAGLSETEADARVATWLRDALAKIDADPRFYTSMVAADDLDAVRAALGYGKINLYGTSYGGTLAQYYLRQHADHVRVAILDGATPIDVPVMERIAGNSQHALDLLFERCRQDEVCNAAFPGLAHEWSALRGRLEAGLTIVDPQTGEKVVLDLLGVGPSIHNALLTGSSAARLPLAIHLAYEGKYELVGELVPPPPSGGAPLLMAEEILCSEAWARYDPSEVARDGAGSYALSVQLAKARSQAGLCRYLPNGIVPADDGAPVSSSVPILWLTADGDPQDPPTNLARVAAQEPNGFIVVVPASEHVVGHLGCGPDVLAAFLDAGSATSLDSSCLSKGAAPNPTFRLP